MTGESSAPTIYIVDDDANLRQALSEVLANAGYTPLAFAHPAEFLQKFDPDLHGCLLLDVRMPDISGLEIQQRLNRMGSLLPVILMSGHGEVPMAVQALREGALDFLQKPFRFQTLLERVNAALKLDLEKRALRQRRTELQRRRESLTPCEHEVMNLLVAEHTDNDIAAALHLREPEVAELRKQVMMKMAANSVAHLIKIQLSLGEDSAL